MLIFTNPYAVFRACRRGNPNEAKYFDYMLSYSPIDNVNILSSSIPALLVTAGLHDRYATAPNPHYLTFNYTATNSSNILLICHILHYGLHTGLSSIILAQCYLITSSVLARY